MKLVKNMNEILDVFYNDFIKEAATGRIDCNMFYNILFATNILRKRRKSRSAYNGQNQLSKCDGAHFRN